eukprot:CAMPEP_0196820392 /NCGR_PEP_ID=MMETSP1362-20130617/75038_1 /TAXON_ID=163516 /ORGANISM="Leptocylindrus danicus, Strain CCMP1856" /LENGTH=632 /DNA_ID=CAMNT_0042199255 /DNA_START=117 /DNA_END=2015 /DNA_ORIENTATION=+
MKFVGATGAALCSLLLQQQATTYVHATTSGSGSCHAGSKITPSSYHGSDSAGEIASSNTAVTINGVALNSAAPNSLATSTTHTLTISNDVGTFRGFLIRVSSPDGSVDASTVISPSNDNVSKGGASWDATIMGNSQVPISCAAGVSAVTHVDINTKSEVRAELVLDQDAALDLEITVMTDTGYTYYYSKYTLQFETPNTDPTSTPSVMPTTATKPPTAAPVTLTPTNSSTPSLNPTTSSKPSLNPTTTFRPSLDTCQSSDPMYQCSVALSDDVTFFYNFTDSNSTHLHARLHYTGQAYLAWGVSKKGYMVGSQAVLGVLDNDDEFSVGKYDLTRYSSSGVELMDLSRQTLQGASFTQSSEDGTTLTFSKLLTEADEIPIDPIGENTFIWARGGGLRLAFHTQEGSFKVKLSLESASEEVEVLDVGSDHQDLWLLHGWLMAAAWCLAVPIAIAASLLRDVLPDKKWFNLHRGMNTVGSLLAFGGLGLAIYLTEDQEGSVHFDGTHQVLGIVVLSCMVVQALGGILRPALPKQGGEEKTDTRTQWEFVHKRFGYVLVLFAAYVVLSGNFAYHNMYDEYDAMPVVIFGLVALLVLGVGTLFLRWKHKQSSSSANDDGVVIQEVEDILSRSRHGNN